MPSLSGTVAIGAPATNADITVQDAKGNTITAKTDATGQFSIDLSKVTGPAVMSVLLSDGRKMYSIWDGSKQGSSATTNITPLTDAVVSEYAKAQNLSPSDITPKSVSPDALKKAKDTVKAWIAAAYQKTGGDASNLDIMNTPFQASGKGLDAVLDSLNFTKDSQGLTVLYPKEVILADGASPSAPTPLSASNSLTTVSSGDSFFPLSQLGTWRTRMNDCMTIQVSARAASSACAGIAPLAYKHDSVNFQTHMFSDTGENNSVGSVFEFPRLLSMSKSTNAIAVDTALVELRWYQPLTQTTHSRIGVFRDLGESGRLQDNKVASATGSTWWLYGNQNDLEIRIEPRLSRYENLNPDSQSTSPSLYFAGIHILINNKKQVSGKWVSADIMAAKVTGPGLPASGLVLAPVDPDQYSSDYLGILNRTGQMPTSLTYAADSVNEFRLGAVPLNADSSSSLDTWWNAQSAKSPFYNETRLQDFSSIQSQANYTVQLIYNSKLTDIKNIRLPGALPSPQEAKSITWPVLKNTSAVLSAMKTPSALITADWSFDTSSLVPEVSFISAYAPALDQCINKKARIWQVEKYMGKKDTAIAFAPTDTSVCWGSTFPGISNNSITDLGIRALQNGTRYYAFVTWRL
ncbi:hypothetical protein B9Z52_05475 [Limnohabitans sp. Jir72]|nr:hypothetical protein B9Z52_05475 [Limnohabitans sp. Jir72]